MKSYIVNENHIGSVVGEILCIDRQKYTQILLLLYKDSE